MSAAALPGAAANWTPSAAALPGSVPNSPPSATSSGMVAAALPASAAVRPPAGRLPPREDNDRNFTNDTIRRIAKAGYA